MEKEVEENDLHMQVMLVTDDTFREHKGFDLANFYDQQYSISDLPVINVLETDTFNDFKEIVAAKYEKQPQQIRFWEYVNRQNKTLRPHELISPDNFNLTMVEICDKFTPHRSKPRFYLEIANKPLDDEVWFPTTNEKFIVFLKFFDFHAQTLECLGSLYVEKSGKVGDIYPILCEKKDLPPNTRLNLYEEIKPNMIIEMNPESTFCQSEIQNGDIICFQKALTGKEIKELFITVELLSNVKSEI
ncbi:1668_t:CDS:2 [Entrophospora sp. SA101]|nr:1668_t:CDS:2 [Entrophospora sp. SA101]CAJ0837104.1 3357_t:CDS:2 [Entrophospora sp. SA101]CAJ0838755.1 13596_t:CDS:2 [Entrophospora sp. SA101]